MKHRENGVAPVVQEAREPERGYVMNRDMPEFVGDTEILRLRKVIDEKNTLIEKFRKYDEQRKAYCQQLRDEYAEMKSSFDSFTEELMKVVGDGEISESDCRKFLKLYARWSSYKNNAHLYKSRIASARQGVKDLKQDLCKITAILQEAGDISLLEQLSDKVLVMRQHLETVSSRLTEG